MRSKGLLRFAGILVVAGSAGVYGDDAPAPGAAATPFGPPAPCDRCEDLCRLMDQYQQREAGIELWKKYAYSTPADQRVPIPPGVTDVGGIENYVLNEFNMWLAQRAADNTLPCRPIEGGGGGGASTDLETDFSTQDCTIKYNKQPLTDQVRHQFEMDRNCRAESNAVIIHEQIHVMHCTAAYAEPNSGGGGFLNDPEMAAESELQAWTAHRDALRDAIRGILANKGCGWQQTYRQKHDSQAVPSVTQMQKMQQRGWKAARALAKANHST